MYTLHYAHRDLQDDIPVIEFSTYNDLTDYVLEIIERSEKCVYLLTFDSMPDDLTDYDEIIVSQNGYYIYNFFKTGMMSDIDLVLDVRTFFLQEYESYEEAYKVALDMNEGKELCYSK